MSKIFISYRREDSQHQADRLCLALSRVVPKRDIFIDIDNIPAGVDFATYLDTRIRECDLLLALIGPSWLDTKRGDRRRIDDTQDFVRLEIAAALKRGIRVAPVLLDGASMPGESDLPDDLKPLARRQAIEVRRQSFASDAERMFSKLGLKPRARRWIVITSLAAALIAGTGIWFGLLSGRGSLLPEVADPRSTISTTESTGAAGSGSKEHLAPAEPTPSPSPSSASSAPAPSTPVTASPPAVASQAKPRGCDQCPSLREARLPSGKRLRTSDLVSYSHWRMFCSDALCRDEDDGQEGHLPVRSITWDAANKYAAWLSAKNGRVFRLPTTSEVQAMISAEPAPSELSAEWTSSCYGGAEGSVCAQREVVVRDAFGNTTVDWHSPGAKGRSIGFRIVEDR